MNAVEKSLIGADKMVSVTLDGWSLCDMKIFVGVTAHWIDGDWNQRSATLRAMALAVVVDEEDVTHENAATILKFLEETLAEFEVGAQSLTIDSQMS